jgi:hypothetical protein
MCGAPNALSSSRSGLSPTPPPLPLPSPSGLPQPRAPTHRRMRPTSPAVPALPRGLGLWPHQVPRAQQADAGGRRHLGAGWRRQAQADAGGRRHLGAAGRRRRAQAPGRRLAVAGGRRHLGAGWRRLRHRGCIRRMQAQAPGRRRAQAQAEAPVCDTIFLLHAYQTGALWLLPSVARHVNPCAPWAYANLSREKGVRPKRYRVHPVRFTHMYVYVTFCITRFLRL